MARQGACEMRMLRSFEYAEREAAEVPPAADAMPFICRHDVLAATGAARELATADLDADSCTMALPVPWCLPRRLHYFPSP